MARHASVTRSSVPDEMLLLDRRTSAVHWWSRDDSSNGGTTRTQGATETWAYIFESVWHFLGNRWKFSFRNLAIFTSSKMSALSARENSPLNILSFFNFGLYFNLRLCCAFSNVLVDRFQTQATHISLLASPSQSERAWVAFAETSVITSNFDIIRYQ